MKRISLVSTVKNERKNIEAFLSSVICQTRPPDEFIIVDGGSKDGTIDVIKDYINNGMLIRLLVVEGANISKGRNIAIENTSYDYIASADAGTTYDKDWLRNLCSFLEHDDSNKIDVVCGFFLPECHNLYEECVGNLLYPKVNLVRWNSFVPSNRSVLFKKQCWRDMGGYPEWLPKGIGEDTYFFSQLRRAGYCFNYSENAICFWQPRENIFKLYKQYFYYARGSTIGGLGLYFLSTAYGNNPIIYSLNNLRQLLINYKFRQLGLSFIIFGTVACGKISGTLCGFTVKLISKNDPLRG